MRVAVIGTGYVGLVSGACLAEFGLSVVCVDNDAAKSASLSRGEIPIYEPGLDQLVATNARMGRLSFTSDLKGAISGADAVFITVGTPSLLDDDGADVSYVYAAADQIGQALAGDAANQPVVVTKSTVPVGTGRQIEAILRRARPNGRIDIASNPEFLREGSAIQDFMKPDRVIIGTESEHARTVLRSLYRPLISADVPVIFTSLETAELIKYTTNAFLATKVAFINEIADLCEELGADVKEVANGVGLDIRIGRQFLHAGPGYGGSCFSKDCRALMRVAQDKQTPLTIVTSTQRANEARKEHMVTKIVTACGGSVAGKTIGALGLTFKPNTDDIRDSPSLSILPALYKQGAAVRAFDPAGMVEAKKLMPEVVYCSDPYAAIEGSDAIILITEWNEFQELDINRIKTIMKTPLMIDLRNVYDPQEMHRNGIDYISVGRSSYAAISRPMLRLIDESS